MYSVWANNLKTKLEPRLPCGNEVTVKLVRDGLFCKSEYYISVFVNPDPSPASLKSLYSFIGHPPLSTDRLHEILIELIEDVIQIGCPGAEGRSQAIVSNTEEYGETPL